MRVARLALMSVGLAYAIGCSDSIRSPIEVNGEQAVLSKISGNDARLLEREHVRGRSSAEFEDAVRRAKNIVAIGFKPEFAPMGVGSRGESLVSAPDVARYTKVVRGFGRVIYQFTNIPAVLLQVPNAKAASALRTLPWVDYVVASGNELTPDIATPSGCTTPISTPQTTNWGLERIGAVATWTYATGTNGKMLVIDDGIDPGSSGELVVSGGIGFLNVPDGPGEHGTLTFSIAGAKNNAFGIVGAAPDATMDVGQGNIDSPDWGWYVTSVIDRAFEGTKVISMSLSTKTPYPFNVPDAFTAMHDAIVNAYYQRGIIVVASTGNQGEWVAAYPARFEEVIGVGGSGYNDEYRDNNFAPGNVEVAAPDVDIDVVCQGGTTIGKASGTSFSTPMVAGAVMLLRQYFPTWSNDDIRSQLRDTAVPMQNADQSGSGRINVYAALGISSLSGVSVGGPSSVPLGYTAQFSATPVGGTGPFVYTWRVNGIAQQTGSSNAFSWSASESYTVGVTVRDATAAERTGSQAVTVCESGVFIC